MAKADLTAERLRELLHYNPEIGVFTRRDNGRLVGGLNKHSGYILIWLVGTNRWAHRLAWLYITGLWPVEVDHKNGIRHDNRWENLRDVGRRENAENQRRPRSKRGLPMGVSIAGRSPQKPYTAAIKTHGKTIFLGYHETSEQAHHVYLEAKRQLHGGCTI